MRITVPLKCAMCCMDSEPSYYTRIVFECDETRICTDAAYRGKIARSLLDKASAKLKPPLSRHGNANPI